MANLDRPRFRQDLVAEAIEEQGARFIDVLDPATDTVFRFYESEFSIACAMDGERDAAGLVTWAKEELGISPSVNEVTTVISTLAELGYLDHQAETRAAATDAPDLAPGIVVSAGAAAPAAGGIDVELGHAGATAAAAANAPVPKAPDLDLGAPGASAAVSAPPRAPVEEVALGAPGKAPEAPAQPAAKAPAADVSLDLAAHIDVRPADVKEAVRASKVMQAVDVPKDVLEAMEAAEAPVKKAEPEKKAADKKAADKKAADKKAADKKAEPEKKAAADKKAEPEKKAAADKKAEPEKKKAAAVAEEKQPVAPPAPRSGVSPALIVLLILAVGGAAVYFGWKYVLNKPSNAAQSSTKAPPQAEAPVAPPAPPPPAPSAQVKLETGSTRTILTMFAGQVEFAEASGKAIKSGDILLKFVGHKRLEAEIANLDRDIERRRTEVNALGAQKDAAFQAKNAAAEKAVDAKLGDRQKRLTEQEDLASNKRDELEKLWVRSNVDGQLTMRPIAKVGAKLPENTPFADVVPDPVPSATFQLPEGTKHDLGIALAFSVNGENNFVTCTVAEWTPEGMRVACNNAEEREKIPEGTTLVYRAP